MDNNEKKYPGNKEETKENKDETQKSDVIMLGIAGGTPSPVIPAAMMMTVYAGPDFWNGNNSNQGLFFAPAPPKDTSVKYCSACGFPLKETDKFCTECGTKVNREENI